MIDIAKLQTWDDPGETICADAAAEIAQLRADALHWAEHESDTWKAMKAEIERLRALSQNNAHSWDAIVHERDVLWAALNRLLLNYGAALPEDKKDQRSIVEARKALGLPG